MKWQIQNWPPLTVDPAYALAVTFGSAAATAILIWLLKPWLMRYALARPNSRSSHTIPTPQGGGIAIIITLLTVVISTLVHNNPAFKLAWAHAPWVWSLVGATVVLSLLGAVDDVHPLPVLPRLTLQLLMSYLLMSHLPFDGRLMPFASQISETAILTVALVWFINLTNFMDGIDMMTVVEILPIAAVLAGLGLFGSVPELTALLPVTLALSGALIGFAPFNRHVAKLFLGDVGSLPLGAILGWLLIVLALCGHWQAALILPAYYLADATITLFRRWLGGENIAQAHSSHFYQRAVRGGLTVPQVTRRVFTLNVALAVMAVATILIPEAMPRMIILCVAALLTLLQLLSFNRAPAK